MYASKSFDGDAVSRAVRVMTPFMSDVLAKMKITLEVAFTYA